MVTVNLYFHPWLTGIMIGWLTWGALRKIVGMFTGA